jgi:hypothetical protein
MNTADEQVLPYVDEKVLEYGPLNKRPSHRVSEPAPSVQVRVLFDHPHSHREWTIIEPDSVPYFYHIASCVDTGFGNQQFSLVVHESQIERIQ